MKKSWLIKIKFKDDVFYVGHYPNTLTRENEIAKAHRWHYKKDAQLEIDSLVKAGWATRESMTLEKC